MSQETPYGSRASTTARDFTEKAAEQYDKMADQASRTAKSVAETGRQIGGDVKEVAGNFQTAVDTSVKSQPMATLALAAALGFLLGAVWKS